MYQTYKQKDWHQIANCPSSVTHRIHVLVILLTFTIYHKNQANGKLKICIYHVYIYMLYIYIHTTNRSCWGHPFFSPKTSQDVHEIVASHRAFAARRGNGSVVTWGDTLLGGDCSMVPRPQLKGMDFGWGAVVYTAWKLCTFGDGLDWTLRIWYFGKRCFFLSTGEVSCLFVKFWYGCEEWKPSYCGYKVFIRKNLSKRIKSQFSRKVR